jgi:ribonuclease-3 family protein
MLLKGGSRPVHALNESARAYVTAVAQGALYHRVFPFLTEEEQGVMRRGRNLHGTSRVRRADMSEYRHATGLEALFGYLHLHGRRERINEIFALCTEGADGEKA